MGGESVKPCVSMKFFHRLDKYFLVYHLPVADKAPSNEENGYQTCKQVKIYS